MVHMTDGKRLDALAGLLLFVLMIVAFAPALTADYVNWDDNLLIVANRILDLPFLEAVKTVFSTYFNGDSIPFTILSFWFEKNVLGLDSSGQHLTNFFLHALNVLILAAALKKFKMSRGAFWIVLGVFAVHPLQVESVAWISERKGLGATFFGLISLFLFLEYRGREQTRLLVFSALSFFVALGFKASVISLPLLLIALDFFHFKKKFSIALRDQLPTLLAATAFAAIRFVAYEDGVRNLSEATLDLERLKLLPIQILHAIGLYISKFLIPIALTPLYPPYSPTHDLWPAVFGAASLLGLCAVAIKQKNLVIATGMLIFLTFLLPVLHLVPRLSHVNDRYMYIPLIGISLAIIFAIPTSIHKPLGILLIFLAGLSYQQSKIWQNSEHLWAHAVSHYPRSLIAQNNLAMAKTDRMDFQGALQIYETAIALNPAPEEKVLLLNNAAILLARRDLGAYDPIKAESRFLEVIRISRNPSDAYEARFNLALLRLDQGHKTQALQDLHALSQDLRSNDARHLGLLKMVQTQIERLR